ncbi:hypothetical protein EDB84DRAFT_1680019 [Lactarius hengduanensis]|nr:hypothetical protein EDB84DRAFT_1680019 [Lactarius hengduanensis]
MSPMPRVVCCLWPAVCTLMWRARTRNGPHIWMGPARRDILRYHERVNTARSGLNTRRGHGRWDDEKGHICYVPTERHAYSKGDANESNESTAAGHEPIVQKRNTHKKNTTNVMSSSTIVVGGWTALTKALTGSNFTDEPITAGFLLSSQVVLRTPACTSHDAAAPKLRVQDMARAGTEEFTCKAAMGARQLGS